MMLSEDIVIRDARKLHHLEFKGTKDVKALVRYAIHVGYNQGYTDKKVDRRKAMVDKVTKLKEFVKILKEKLEEVHPNWRECDICCSPMEYLLIDKNVSLDTSISHARSRMRVIMTEIRRFSPAVCNELRTLFRGTFI